MSDQTTTYTVRVLRDADEITLTVAHGANLREALLGAGLSPYTALPARVNCGGRGICATCGVWIETNEPAPAHWHDQLASRFGYPRLSCQIRVESDMTIRLLSDKLIWGARDGRRARRWA
jgi:ferredoxin